MREPASDTSGVRIFPPFIYAGLFVLGYALHRFVPVRLWPDAPPSAVRAAAWCLVAVWAVLGGSAVWLFRRAGTTPNPAKPTTAVVMHGPYRVTRNPMYLGLVALYIALTIFLNSAWPLLLLPVVIVLVQRQVIAREEAYLEAKFGEEYRAYKARVRRWI